MARLGDHSEAGAEGSEDKHCSAASTGGGLIAVLDTGGVEGLAPAGALRRAAMGAGMKPPPSGVDAVVAAAADARAEHGDVVIVTSDHGDFQMLGSLATNAPRLSVLVV